MRYAVLNSENTVENVIVAYPEAIAGLSAALGKTMVQAGEIPLSVGDLYDPLLGSSRGTARPFLRRWRN